MKISEVYPEYVFQRLGKGLRVDAVDYNKPQYIQLGSQTVAQVQRLIEMPNVKFFQLEEDEETETEG